MPEKTFLIKEAIAHGFAMTKKYFKVIFIAILIYFAFSIFRGVLSSRAGVGNITKSDLAILYKDQAAADRFFQYLQSSQYVTRFGTPLERLRNLKSASELMLPDEFAPDQARIFRFLQMYTYRLPFPMAVYYVLAVVLWLISILMGVGLLKMSILMARDQQPSVNELFANGRLIGKYLLGSIGFGLAVLGGLVLLIIPAFFVMIMLGMYGYFIVDQEMGPFESLKASRALTKGVRWQLFLFGLLLFLMNIAGAVCLLVGLLFTVPASYVASAYVYDQLLKAEEPEPAAIQ